MLDVVGDGYPVDGWADPEPWADVLALADDDPEDGRSDEWDEAMAQLAAEEDAHWQLVERAQAAGPERFATREQAAVWRLIRSRRRPTPSAATRSRSAGRSATRERRSRRTAGSSRSPSGRRRTRGGDADPEPDLALRSRWVDE